MFSLNATLSTAAGALNAAGGAIAITNSNVSNVNTPGYSRQIVNLSAIAISGSGSLQNSGVSFNGYTSVRDAVLQAQVTQKSSAAASLTAQQATWSQVETAFSSVDTGLGTAISNLFSSVSALSTSPGNTSLQQAAYSSAGQLANAFHQDASALSGAREAVDQNIGGLVNQVNGLTTQIAALNKQLSVQTASGAEGGALQDQRDALTAKLAQLTFFDSVRTEGNPTLALSSGTPLVIGSTAYSLSTGTAVDGQTHVYDSSGADITSSLVGGSLGGALQMRDQSIPAISQSLDTLASQFAAAMNQAQAQGCSSSGVAGQPLFALPPSGSGAAAGISVAITTPGDLALSSAPGANNGVNILNLLAVQSAKLPGGQTPTNTYADLVETVGAQSAATTQSLTATNAALSQLSNLQSTESGVSIDEETTNLIRYQQAYSAAAQVIKTIDQLFSSLLQMSN